MATSKPPQQQASASTKASPLVADLVARAHTPRVAQRILSEKLAPHRPFFLYPSERSVGDNGKRQAADTPSAGLDGRETRRLRRARSERELRKKKLKPKPLSARERRRRGLHDVPRRDADRLQTSKNKSKGRGKLPQGAGWHVYVGLHRLWSGYMREVLGGDLHGLHGTGGGGNSRSRTTAMYQAGVGGDGLGATPSSAGPGPLVGELTLSKLAAADLHGALVTVVRSRCVSRVGIRGIVVRDRRGVLEIVVPPSSKRQKTGGEAVDVNMTQGEDRGQDQIGGDTHGKGSDGEVKMVPKEGTVFRIEVSLDDDDDPAVDGGRKRFVFEMLGDQFIYRSAERATRKFKAHYVKDL